MTPIFTHKKTEGINPLLNIPAFFSNNPKENANYTLLKNFNLIIKTETSAVCSIHEHLNTRKVIANPAIPIKTTSALGEGLGGNA